MGCMGGGGCVWGGRNGVGRGGSEFKTFLFFRNFHTSNPWVPLVLELTHSSSLNKIHSFPPNPLY